MSSILDALKKAEQESSPDREKDSPWLPLPDQPPRRQRRRWRWWVPLGLVVLLAVAAAVVWLVRTPGFPRPGASPPVQTNDSTPPVVAKAPPSKPAVAVAAKQQAPSATAVKAGAPGRGADDAPPPETASPLPPARPPKQSPAVDSPAPKPMVPPATQPTMNARRETLAPQPAPPIAPALPESRPTEVAEPVPRPPDSGKPFRNDPRIDLQALVWAPEAAARFVVINNRLIKEGGSLDNIVVVTINPDDVLLAEGANRWYVEFKVR